MKTSRTWYTQRSRNRSRDGLEITPLLEHDQIVLEYRELLINSEQ
ncbi:hypothetical protein SAMN02745170_04045 [Propionispora hippei DSM 15287]|uniref:Uncharacterized protein n=1 Tax=Propionispora hippei DSM 15287 TaxID=1123003 RepID=A0A1M6LRV4_9FIRM|nr:hypothetical protein SAMN02745170_02616 [Propionispora hippei DSM 15287]SHJ73930.1 hypothetical protein SAMN02745170_03214 [Propionispora hippei DSM 15287]SHJ84990.1 hypothetical protein SAMN02745170_03487 [Propionispora hippei DSM 15287]SHK07728.1 hypothetical protein SAMN02745170_04045 [Propionispora hippei DSM 15287]